MINIKITGLKELIKGFNDLDVEKTLNKGVKKSVIFLQGESIRVTPIDTGLLRGSYKTGFKRLEGELYNTRKYGIYVHEGTRYIKKRPFLTETLKRNEKKVNLIFNKEVDKMLITNFK